MDHYIDIRLLPDPEFHENFLMNALFSKLHRTLVTVSQLDIGVSFPDAKKSLGDTLRLHAKKERLVGLMELPWLKGMSDHTLVGHINEVPEGCSYRVIKRIQTRSSAERLRRRAMKRHNVDYQVACERYPCTVEKQLHQPFIQVKSQSTGKAFRLFIDQSTVAENPVPGQFSAYGLSSHATVPWF